MLVLLGCASCPNRNIQLCEAGMCEAHRTALLISFSDAAPVQVGAKRHTNGAHT